jgi:hypothetical protein
VIGPEAKGIVFGGFPLIFVGWHKACLRFGVTVEINRRGAKTRFRRPDMSFSDRFARVATAMVGALVISTLSIGAAVGPVQAADSHQSWISALPFGAPTHG